MSSEKPMTVICHYRVKPGKEAEMESLLTRHWPALHSAGLTTDEPAVVYRGLAGDKGQRHGAPGTYLEIFAWKTEKSVDVAHRAPEVMAVWEPMNAICESMEFPAFERMAPHSS